jgi:hypothetical protein
MVTSSATRFGTLDMTGWGRIIDQIDRLTEQTIEAGLFTVEQRQTFIVAEAFDSGAEMLAVASGWVGTTVPPSLAQRVAAEDGPVQVDQAVRLRILRANGTDTVRSRRMR